MLHKLKHWLRPWRRHKVRVLGLLLAVQAALAVTLLALLQSQLRQSYSSQSDTSDSEDLIPDASHLRQTEYLDRRGIHVIVAHYQGSGLPYEQNANITHDLINRNEYSPMPGAGENGEPVYLPDVLHARAKSLFHIHSFNLMVSDRISINRTLPDERNDRCKSHTFAKNLPSTSIIIVFHNEAWSTLMRTIYSAINRSPRRLLHEIILVDDASDRAFLKQPLEDYIVNFPVPVKLVRQVNRTGLIRARLKGAAIASGQVLTFLDAHCECTEGWLEPLLERIAENRTHVVCPIIDIINDETFAYVRTFETQWGAFNWALHFRWFGLSHAAIKKRSYNSDLPFRTPVMAGGLFSIDKSYFEEMGAYDSDMKIWGGENIEISFRIWLCGGSVEIVPCSHVGHIFRNSSPYSFPGGVASVLYANLARVALVWMDEWKEFFFKINPEAGKLRNSLNVTSRMSLRRRLKCNSFSWFLDNVWPQHSLPTEHRFFGKIRNMKTGRCLQKPQTKDKPTYIGEANIHPCAYEIYAPQLLVVSPAGYIMTDESVCLDVPHLSPKFGQVMFMACNQAISQRWKYDLKKYAVIHQSSGFCLDLPNRKEFDALIVQSCSNDSKSQRWQFEHVNWSS